MGGCHGSSKPAPGVVNIGRDIDTYQGERHVSSPLRRVPVRSIGVSLGSPRSPKFPVEIIRVCIGQEARRMIG